MGNTTSSANTRLRAALSIIISIVMIIGLMPALTTAHAEEAAQTDEATAQVNDALDQAGEPSSSQDEGDDSTPSSVEQPEVVIAADEHAAQDSDDEASVTDSAATDAAAPKTATTSDDDATTSDDELAPQEVTGGPGTLKVSVDAGSGFNDVGGAVPFQWNWESNFAMLIDTTFKGTDTGKTLKIQVPTGWELTAYSAVEGTSAITGAEQLPIDNDIKSKVLTSDLKDAAGTGDFADQQVTGYTGGTAYTHGGTVTYTFDDSAEHVWVKLQLQPDKSWIARNLATYVMPTVTATMTSSAGSINDSVVAQATNISVPYVNNSPFDYNVRVDDTTHKSEEFEVGSHMWAYYAPYVPTATVTYTYPAGVYYADKTKFNMTGIPYGYTDTTVPINEHVSVTKSENAGGGGTLTYTYSKIKIGAWEIDQCPVFYAMVNDGTSPISVGDTVQFKTDYAVGSIPAITDPAFVNTSSNTMKRTFLSAGTVNLDVTPYSDTSQDTRRDFHADCPGYGLTDILGGFQMKVPVDVEDIDLKFEFPETMGIRGVTLGGQNIKNIVATTSTGRTINIASISEVGNTGGGTPINPELLGLNPGEYLKTLSANASFVQGVYGNPYDTTVSGALCYFGEFLNGQEGDVKLTVSSASQTITGTNTATDHTNIGWTNNQVKEVITAASHTPGGALDANFYPNETMYLTSTIKGGGDLLTSFPTADTIVDPVAYLCIPEGIDLDTTSVMAVSPDGNNGNTPVQLVEVGTPVNKVVNGANCLVYAFTSATPLDMVAHEASWKDASTITLSAAAFITSGTPDRGGLNVAQMVQWDLGQTVDGNFGYKDDPELAGKGTDYKIAHGGNTPTHINSLIGFNADLAIRVAGSGDAYHTYNGTGSAASIAAISPDKNAELKVSWANTGESDYATGTSIYLPVPKKGLDYQWYFENMQLDNPKTKTDITKTFSYSLSLAEEPSLGGSFDTYYAVVGEVSQVVGENDPTTLFTSSNTTLAPVKATSWYTKAELDAAGKSLADVAMVKFVANAPIAHGTNGSDEFEFAVDTAAGIGDIDYWRAMIERVQTSGGAASAEWEYSSAVAASVGVELNGQVFIDKNLDGKFVETDGDTKYTDQNMALTIRSTDGAVPPYTLTLNADGTFASLTGTAPRYLAAGEYIVEITNNDDATYDYERVEGAASSTNTDWYNDIKTADVASPSASFTFTVTEGQTNWTEYVGIGLTDKKVPVTFTFADDAISQAAAAPGAESVTPATPTKCFVNSATGVTNANATEVSGLYKFDHWQAWTKSDATWTKVEDTVATADIATYTVPDVDELQFRAVYTIDPTSPAIASVDVVKQLSGDTPEAASAFNFTCEPAETNPSDGAHGIGSTATITGAGAIAGAFGTSITFSAPGTYTYTIKEVDNGIAGYTYDGSVYTWTISVANKGGACTITDNKLTKDGAAATSATFDNKFTSTVTPAVVTESVDVVKQLSGQTPDTASTFDFTCEAAETNPTGGASGVGTSASISGAGTITDAFGTNITFSAPGTYTYTIKETNGGVVGYTYDASSYIWTVKVEQEGNAYKVAQNTLTKDGVEAKTATFDNKYETPIPPAGKVEVTKTADKVTAQPGEEIAYTITVKNADTVDAVGVWVKDKMPSGTEFSSVADDAVAKVAADKSYVTWFFDTIAAGETKTLAMKVKVLDSASAVSNTALYEVTGSTDEPDPSGNPSNMKPVATPTKVVSDTPKAGTTPTKAANPAGTVSTTKGATSASTAKTADEAPLLPLVFIAISAAGAVFFARRKRSQD